MSNYSDELLLERTAKRQKARLMLSCYLSNVAPNFEQCKKHFDEIGLLLTKPDYNDICKKMAKKKPGEI